MTSRYEYLQVLAPLITDELIVCSNTQGNRDWACVKHRDGNLYHVWMSGASAVALGMAVSLPHRRVLSLDGDGSALMGLPVLPAIAKQNPSNLTVIVFDNECFALGNTNVPTFTAGTTDLEEAAHSLGIPNVWRVEDPEQFKGAVTEAFEKPGASFITAKALTPSPNLTPPPVGYGAENKYRFIRYIEETERIPIITAPHIFGMKRGTSA